MAYTNRKDLHNLSEELDNHLRRLLVFGFNSQKYDINVIKGPLLCQLQRIVGEDFAFLVKKKNSMACVETNFCRFLDITNYIAPGHSYDKYIKAFNCDLNKGFFLMNGWTLWKN